MRPTKWLRKVKFYKDRLPKGESEGPFYFTAERKNCKSVPKPDHWFWEDGSAIYSRSFATAKERDEAIKAFKAALNEFCDRIDKI